MLETITEFKMPVLIEDLGLLYATSKSKNKFRWGLFKCSCGNDFKAVMSSIKNGNTKSCGCYNIKCIIERKTTHGLCHHPLYKIWIGMIKRTTNSKNKSFKDYGGRGIIVCERWKDVKNFIEDIKPTYIEGLSIDRINNDGNYEPSNCRWATQSIQSRNTRVIHSHNTSGYRGVSWHSTANKWRARIKVNSISKHLGFFTTALEGAIAYDKFVIENNLEHTINGVLVV